MTNKQQEKIRRMTQEEKIRNFKKLQEALIFLSDEIYDFKKKIGTQTEVLNYIRGIAPIDCEQVFTLYLDAKNGIIDFTIESKGTLTQSLVYPREILKKAIDLGALSVILVHNHPSGSPEPSEADREITRKLLFACRHMDINLLDHMIIGAGEKYYSFYESGNIDRLNNDFKNLVEGM